MQPIIQADANVGYDSPAQYHTWWDSACSAAVLAEVLHAWGINTVTIGQMLDLLIAAHAISPDQGLYDQNGWDAVAQHYHLRGDQHWTRSYADIVQLVTEKGLPVVANVRDSAHRYFPAFDTGHYLVIVGADSAGVMTVDSSLYRIHHLTVAVFQAIWSGQTILIAPQELLA